VDVSSWLRGLGLERYEATFRENEVSSDLLCQLTAEELDVTERHVVRRRQKCAMRATVRGLLAEAKRLVELT
jgi:hypothetical protein